MSSNITDLVSKAQFGDVEAFGELYEIFSKDLYKFAYYYTGNSYLAQDAVSEAVLIAFEKIRQLRKAESFKSWMFKILSNCCKATLKNKIQSNNNVDYSLLEEVQGESVDFCENISLNNAVALLDSDDREIVLLSFVFGYNSKEIGKITGLKDGTVRSKISRSISKLREILSVKEGELI